MRATRLLPIVIGFACIPSCTALLVAALRVHVAPPRVVIRLHEEPELTVDQMPQVPDEGEGPGAEGVRAMATTSSIVLVGSALGVGGLARAATRALPGSVDRAVHAATALALLFDFAPSGLRAVKQSDDASRAAAEGYCVAASNAILVDNFVHNLGAANPMRTLQKKEASERLAASHRWALFVRSRLLGDVTGVLLMLRGHACLGAAFLLSAHAAFWACGGAAARVDENADPSPLSPPLARIVGGACAALAAAAACGGIGPESCRALGGRAYAVAIVAIQAARLLADRVRRRVHVGL